MGEMHEVMNSEDLRGRRVTLQVDGKEPPAMIAIGDYRPLIVTVAGRIDDFVFWPGGPVGLLTADDGTKIAFDAGLDIINGRVTILVEKDHQN